MRITKALLTLSLLAITMLVSAQPYTNPVLKNVSDAGVLKHAGKYYIGGVNTYGDFFVSNDLVNWDDRIHVFDLDNDWTHGTGAKNNQVHADDITYSGGLFHLLFSVNWWGKDRHIVHITHATSRNIEGPYEEVRKDQWFENRIDPQIFRDEDGKIYLYMVKFTDGNTIWARPLNNDFTFAGDAVQQFSSQQGTWETMDNRVAEGPFVIKYRGRYYMMYNANHTAVEYGNYRLGVCEAPSPLAFGPGGKYPQPVVSPQTEYLDNNYADLIRYGSKGYNNVDLNHDTITFKLDEPIKNTPYLKIAYRGGCKVKLNGVAIDTKEATNAYKLVKLDKNSVRVGTNTINIERNNSNADNPRRRGRLVALALYDMPEDMSGSLLLTPGQPNIVRGPNGWEWWLVYMANTEWGRDQFIDRIHFTGNRLYVDGITGNNTSGFHVNPALPQYSGTSLAEIPDAESYLLELTFSSSAASPGISLCGTTIALPGEMDKNVVHEWRIEKNNGLLTAWIDNILVANHIAVSSNFKPRFVGAESEYNVKYISFNEGFDEYGPYFSGWKGMRATSKGLVMKSADVVRTTPAYDYEYSVLFNNTTPEKGKYGVYAAYVDAKNYVRVVIDAAKQTLITENVIKGKSSISEVPLAYTSVHYPDLKNTDSFEKQYWFDSPTFVSEVEMPHLDADNDTYARVLNLKEAPEKSYRDDMIGRMTMEYLDGTTWRPISYSNAQSDNRAWQKAVFPAVKARALRFINSDPEQHSRNIYHIKTRRDFAAEVQLRIEKRGADIHIFADNRELKTIKMKKAEPTSVGLYSEDAANVFVANTLYYPVSQKGALQKDIAAQ